MQENPYQPPSAVLGDLPMPTGMDGLTPKEVQRLYYRSSNVNVIAFLLVFGVFAIGWMFHVGIDEPEVIVASQWMFYIFLGALEPGIVLAGLLVFYAFTSLGLLLRSSWGRVLGIMACIISLTIFPFGTIIGVFGLVAFFKAKILFGKGRVTHKEVQSAYNELKAAKRISFWTF